MTNAPTPIQLAPDTARLFVLFLEKYDILEAQDRDLYRSFLRCVANPPMITFSVPQSIQDSRWIDEHNARSEEFLEWDRHVRENYPVEVHNLLWGDWHRKKGVPEIVDGLALIESHNSQIAEAFRRGEAVGINKKDSQ